MAKALDFILSERRDTAAATTFFKRAIVPSGILDKVVIDKSGADYAGLGDINILFWLFGFHHSIDILHVKYLNNIIEQDHRLIKRMTNPMMGFKSFHTALATISGIEVAHMIHKNQFANDNSSPLQVFAELAA